MNAALSPFVDATQSRSASVVFWSARVMEVDPLTLLTAMREHAPAHADLVRQPVKPHTALSRAVRRCQAGMPEGARWERIGLEGEEVVAAYIEESYDVEAEIGERVRSGDVLAVRVDKSGGFVVNHRMGLTDDQQDQVDRLRARYSKERGCLTHSDITELIKEIIMERCDGIRVKAGGAVFFVPSPQDEVIDGLTEAMKVAAVDVIALPLFDKASLGQFTGAAKTSLLEEAESLREQAARRLAKAQAYREASAQAAADGTKAPSPPKWAAYERRLVEAKAIVAKAELYESLLGCAVDDVKAAAEDARQVVRQAMKELTGC